MTRKTRRSRRKRQLIRPAITALEEMEKQAILHAIQVLDGDKLEAARRLGIGKTTLYRKLKEYGSAL